MARQEVKDRAGRKLGWIDDKPNEQIGFDAAGRRKGRYDKKYDVTYDAAGRRIGTGNQLAALIVA